MDNSLTDRTAEVRQGEELPVDRLAEYLRSRLPGWSGDLTVKQFPSGHSNLTYLLQAGEQEAVLRRPPFGAKIKSAHDMGREYQILSRLHPVYPKVPRPILYCEDSSVIGAPFYLMERLSGLILRRSVPEGLNVSPQRMRTLAQNFIDNLAAIHGVDYAAAGLAELGHPGGYAARQVQGWTERYARARTDDIPEIEQVAAWLAGHLPPESGATLIHNDYKYDSVILDPADLQIVAVLDWEMATIGDPLMDLGTTLGYWVEASDGAELRELAFGPTMLPGNLTRAELVERYAQVSGRSVSHIRFYYVYALFKIAVIVQQIYNRYHQGFSRDPRFARMLDSVHVLARAAAREVKET